MKITIEFNSVEEYLEFKGKTAQEVRAQEQPLFLSEDSINGKYYSRGISKSNIED